MDTIIYILAGSLALLLIVVFLASAVGLFVLMVSRYRLRIHLKKTPSLWHESAGGITTKMWFRGISMRMDKTKSSATGLGFWFTKVENMPDHLKGFGDDDLGKEEQEVQ